MSADTLDLLSQAQQGDREAEEDFLRANSGLIWAVAKRYYGRGVEPEDLYQLGCLGFLKAVRGFDRGFGTQFSTYAVPKIAGEIRRYLRDSGYVKVGRTIRERGLAIQSARERLRFTLGREPTLSELESETGLDREDIASAELATAAPDSLQQENAEGLTLESTLTDSEGEESMVERLALREAIRRLPDQERETILLRFYRGLTQQQCARVLSVSQVQISRLERRALGKLREELGDTGKF
jgi:RNA polymerase sporulation-specific sigma factor